MKKRISLGCRKAGALVLVLALGLACEANSTLIDFESTGLSEGATLTTEIPGLTFVDTIIAEEGTPCFAFTSHTENDDTVLTGEPFGGFFITDALVGGDPIISQTITVLFDVPVFDLSCRVADLDGSTKGPEVLTAKAFDAKDTLLETVMITAGDEGTGDSIATLLELSTGDISRLTVRVARELEDRAGWGIDNLSYTPIPAPGALMLGSIGAVFVSGLRRRRML